MPCFAALDVSRETTAICVVDDDGTIIAETAIAAFRCAPRLRGLGDVTGKKRIETTRPVSRGSCASVGSIKCGPRTPTAIRFGRCLRQVRWRCASG